MDLSQLSDEQLQVYRDLLAQKLNPPDTRGLPPGQTAPPGIPSPALPQALQSQPEGKDFLEKLENGIHDGSFPGPMMVVNGIKQLAGSIPAFSNSIPRGAADVIEGAGKVASPLLAPAAIAAPGATALGLGGGLLGQKLSEAAIRRMGASPDAQRLAGDLGGAVAGGLAGRYAATRPSLSELQNPGSFNLPEPGLKARVAAKALPGGKTGLRIYEAVREYTNNKNGGKSKVPPPPVSYPQRPSPVAAPAITFPEQLSPVAAPAVSYPQKPGVVAAPQVTFPETQAPVSAPPVTYSRQAATKVVPAPPVTYPAPPAPTKVVPPPPLSWLTRAEEAPTVPAGTDKVVVKNGQPFTNQNGKLAPATKPAGLPRGADGKFISPLEKQLQDSITNALARKTKK